MMDRDSSRRSKTLGFELIERTGVAGRDAWPELLRPVARLRSPIMEHRSIQPLPADPDRMTVVLPPARDFIRPMAWAMLAAVPVLALVGWQAAIVVGAATAFIREVDRRVGRSDFTFADGFLGFRTRAEWPRGVQEDDDVRWNWSGAQHGQGAQG
jgi:hypothetical protein